MKKLYVGFMTACLALSLVVTGCSKGSGGESKTDPPATANPTDNNTAGTPVKGGTFTYATTSDVSMMIPTLSQDTGSNFVQRLIFDSLLRLNDKFEWTPWVAKELPTVEKDGKRWIFKLRTDVKFHDGQPLTSKDVRFTFEQVQHPTYPGVRASNFARLKGVAELRKQYAALGKDVEDKKLTADEADKQKLALWEKWKAEGGALETPDPYTFIINLDSVFAPLFSNVAGVGIMPEHLLKDQVGAKLKESEFARKPVGSGRYQFVDWKTQDKVVLKANENWWGGRPNIDNFIYKIYPDSNTAMAALEKGEIDFTTLEVESLPHFSNDVKNVKVLEYPSTSYQQITYDLNNELFKDVNVRHALAHAIDKETMVKQLLQGHGAPAWSHATPTRWDYTDKVFKPAYDVKKAEQLLADAGWKKGADGVLAKNGKRFSFDFYVDTSDKTRMESAQVVQSFWKAIGVEANIKTVDFSTLLDLSDASNPDRKQPPVYVLGWDLGSDPDSYSIWACDGSFNDIGYCNKRVDELMNKGRDVVDQAQRTVIYQEIQQILAQEQPYTWLYFPNNTEGIATKVKGPVTPNPSDTFFNFQQWWIDPNVK